MKNLTKNSGFTLSEILISVLVLAVLFTGVLLTFLKCAELHETSSNATQAAWAAKNKLIETENTPFNQVNADYDNVPFALTGLNGMGVSYVDDSIPGILTITTVVGWRQRNGRLFGEDIDLDGILDAGEDLNANGRLDSIVQFSTQRFNT